MMSFIEGSEHLLSCQIELRGKMVRRLFLGKLLQEHDEDLFVFEAVEEQYVNTLRLPDKYALARCSPITKRNTMNNGWLLTIEFKLIDLARDYKEFRTRIYEMEE